MPSHKPYRPYLIPPQIITSRGGGTVTAIRKQIAKSGGLHMATNKLFFAKRVFSSILSLSMWPCATVGPKSSTPTGGICIVCCVCVVSNYDRANLWRKLLRLDKLYSQSEKWWREKWRERSEKWLRLGHNLVIGTHIRRTGGVPVTRIYYNRNLCGRVHTHAGKKYKLNSNCDLKIIFKGMLITNLVTTTNVRWPVHILATQPTL